MDSARFFSLVLKRKKSEIIAQIDSFIRNFRKKAGKKSHREKKK